MNKPGCGSRGGLVAQSCPTLATSWIVARQIPMSMGFPGQEYWSGLPFPSLRDIPHPNSHPPGIELASPALTGGSLPLSPQEGPCLSLVLLYWDSWSEDHFSYIYNVTDNKIAFTKGKFPLW